MNSTNFIDDLNVSLEALDAGMDIEFCLSLFPARASEFRPILIAAEQAKSIRTVDIPAEVLFRGKQKVLAAADSLRENQVKPVTVVSQKRSLSNIFSVRFMRLAITTASMFAFLLTGGTGLVSASSKALPGDSLYPVKRKLEDVRIYFVSDPQLKKELSEQYEHERFTEIEELYAEKKTVQVDFQGIYQGQKDGYLIINGLNIEFENNLNIPFGSFVHITGETSEGVIKADNIILVATPVVTPTVEMDGMINPTGTVNPFFTPEPNEDGRENQLNSENTPEVQSSDSEEDQTQNIIEPTENHSGDNNNFNKNENNNQNTNDNSGHNDNKTDNSNKNKNENENSNDGI